MTLTTADLSHDIAFLSGENQEKREIDSWLEMKALVWKKQKDTMGDREREEIENW